jgi:hypothetical protein
MIPNYQLPLLSAAVKVCGTDQPVWPASVI